MKKKILVIYHIRNPHQAPYKVFRDLRILDIYPDKYEIDYFNTADIWKEFKTPYLDLPACPEEYRKGEYDVIILHYTFLIYRCIGALADLYMHPFGWLAYSDALKIAIPQDEGNHAAILDDWFLMWGVDVVFSVQYRPEGPLYPLTRKVASIYPCLPGYVDPELPGKLPKAKKIEDRGLHIVYRGRPFNPRFGKASYLKSMVALKLGEAAEKKGLKTDISVLHEDRIYGEKWFDFIQSSKTIFGVYGGYSAVDRRGEIKERVSYLTGVKGLESLEEVSAHMPQGWDDHELFTVTPRHFEAIACRTVQILVRHDYRGVMEAGRHYIPLEEDLSNLDQVLESVRDDALLSEIAERAYEEIQQSGMYEYERFAEQLDQVIREGRESRDENDETRSGRRELVALQEARREDRRRECERLKYIHMQLAHEYGQCLERGAGQTAVKTGVGPSFKRGLRQFRLWATRFFRRSYYLARRYVIKAGKMILGSRQ